MAWRALVDLPASSEAVCEVSAREIAGSSDGPGFGSDLTEGRRSPPCCRGLQREKKTDQVQGVASYLMIKAGMSALYEIRPL